MTLVRTLDDGQMAAALAIAPALRFADVLIFDGDCRFCIAQSARLAAFANGSRAAAPAQERLHPLPLQMPGLLEAIGLSHDEAMSAMQLVTQEGRIYRGLEAAVQAVRHRPILGRLAKLYYVPGFKQLGDLGYRLVARYRYAIMGRAVARGECDGACAIHLRKPS